MAEVVVTNFSAGEFSPQVYGRIDIEQYQSGAKTLKNVIILPQGAVKKRPGTKYLAASAANKRIVPFQVGADTSYVVELSNAQIRILDEDGAEQADFSAPGTPTPTITTAMLDDIKYVQSTSEIVLVHRDTNPHLITWNGSTFALDIIVTGEVAQPDASGNANVNFDLTADDYPGAVTFADGRLIFGGTDNIKNGIFASEMSSLLAYIDGALSINFDIVDSPADTDPYAYEVLDYGYIDIQWLVSSSTISYGSIMAGTSTGLYALDGIAGQGITGSSSLSASRQGSTGCSSVQGVAINDYMIFVDATKRAIRMAQFNLDQNQFLTPRITDLSNHLFDSDIKSIHYQRAPYTILWVVLEDGSLLAFNSTAGGSVAGWTRMEFGGDSVVESMCVLPGIGEDTVMFIMKNDTTYTLERFASFTEDDQDEFWYVDCGLRREVVAANTVADITLSGSSEVSIEATAHGYVTGDFVAFDSVGGTVELNTGIYQITKTDADNFTLDDTDSTNFTAYTSGGTVALSGYRVAHLDHLEDETVQVWADGAAHSAQTVDDNYISLNRDTDIAIVGRAFTAEVETLPIAEAQTRTKRVHKMFVRFHETLDAVGGESGWDETIPFREGGFLMGEQPEPFTGMKEINYSGGYEFDGTVRITSPNPGPFTVLSITTALEAN